MIYTCEHLAHSVAVVAKFSLKSHLERVWMNLSPLLHGQWSERNLRMDLTEGEGSVRLTSLH
jgi:hypothetical protein